MFSPKKPSLTAAGLVQAGYQPRTPTEVIRREVLARLESSKDRGAAIHQLFPSTLVDDDVLEPFLSALLAGNNVLLFGPSGSGKTSLAKDVLRLFPKEIYSVAGCPVQDDPLSLTDPKFAERAPACPFCKMTFGKATLEEIGDFDPRAIDPATVPVLKTRIREGRGFARVQGSSEVFPDNLTGTINLRKLEEIGDPTSPLVLEPGKLLQANRGVLIVDEVGKLPLGTQNVLLQALQEHVVTPAKSRETFPGSFLALTTSNMDDLDAITGPLGDRLSDVYLGFSKDHGRNRRIIDLALMDAPQDVFITEMFLETAVYLIEAWRRETGEVYELSEVGSNRTLIDIIGRSESFTCLRGGRRTTIDDLRRGVQVALLSHVRARGGDAYERDKETVLTFIAKNLDPALKRAGEEYWCGFFASKLKEDEAAAVKLLEAGRRVAEKGGRIPEFHEYVIGREGRRGPLTDEQASVAVFKMLDGLGVWKGSKA